MEHFDATSNCQWSHCWSMWVVISGMISALTSVIFNGGWAIFNPSSVQSPGVTKKDLFCGRSSGRNCSLPREVVFTLYQHLMCWNPRVYGPLFCSLWLLKLNKDLFVSSLQCFFVKKQNKTKKNFSSLHQTPLNHFMTAGKFPSPNWGFILTTAGAAFLHLCRILDRSLQFHTSLFE